MYSRHVRFNGSNKNSIQYDNNKKQQKDLKHGNNIIVGKHKPQDLQQQHPHPHEDIISNLIRAVESIEVEVVTSQEEKVPEEHVVGGVVSDDVKTEAADVTAKVGGTVSRVSFGGVSVYVHNLTLGDHPGGTTTGPPLTLEWKMDNSYQFKSVESFERYAIDDRHKNRRSRRPYCNGGSNEGGEGDDDQEYDASATTTSVKIIDPSIRQLIAGVDHTSNDIRKALFEVHRIRAERLQSKKEDMEKALEKEERKLAKMVARQKRKSKHGNFNNNMLARRLFFSGAEEEVVVEATVEKNETAKMEARILARKERKRKNGINSMLSRSSFFGSGSGATES